MEKTNQTVQIVRDGSGTPVAAIVPWDEYERLRAGLSEDAQLIALAIPHRGETAFPEDVARRMITGEVPLKAIREWRGITQAALAEKAGVATQYISQIERGERNLGKKAALKLAPALGVVPEDLMI